MSLNISRHEILGLSEVGCDPTSAIRRIQMLPTYEATLGINEASNHKQAFVHDAGTVTLNYYLLGNSIASRHWAERLLEYADIYYFGSWRDIAPSGEFRRDPPSREYWDKHARWFEDFDIVMLCAALLGRWIEFERFATYLRDDVELNYDQAESHRAWWLYYCGIVRKRPAVEIECFRATVANQTRKLEKLLLAWVDALVSGSDQQLQTAVDEYFRHFRQREAKKVMRVSPLSIRGSMLLAYGKRLGRTPDVPDEAQVYTIEF